MGVFRFLAIAIFFVFVFSPSSAFAQDAAGVSIVPATIEDAADPGGYLERTLEVTNLSTDEQTYYLFVRDIIGVRDGNAPDFANENWEPTGFEISSWITLPSEPFVLQPNETMVVPVQISVPEDATPGSHFGGVFVSIEPPRLRTIGASVAYEVASIVSIKISGDAVTNAQIREFSTEKVIHGSTNVRFDIRVQNTGNVLVRPYGPLEVYNMFGSQVFSKIFNENQAGVFPGTIRDFTDSWSDENPGFGRYQANLALIYETESGNRTTNATVTFWILPMNIIGPAGIALIVVILVGYFGVRFYVRRAVRMASGGASRQLVRRRRKSKQISILMLVSIVLLTVTALFLILLLILFA